MTVTNTNNNITMRDTNLDIYRALIMIYILCVIHVGFWLKFIDEPLRSLILFEMPIIFFISGAALSVTTKRHSFNKMLIGRFTRIAVPYYVYIVICVAIAFVLSHFLPDIFKCDLNLKSFVELTTFRLTEGFAFPFFYHTWFILPYLLIYIIFWFEQKICDRVNPWLVSVFLLLICIISQISESSFIKTTAIYNFFFVVGYQFYKKLRVRTIAYILLSSALCLTLCLSHDCRMGGVKPMQYYKFAGDIIFLFYGLTSLSAFSILFSYISIKPNKCLNVWNSKGYTIYLWQNLSFIIVFGIMKFFPLLNNILVAMVLIFIISSLTCFPAHYVETMIKSIFTRLFKRINHAKEVLKRV